jgi:hypothetical protein
VAAAIGQDLGELEAAALEYLQVVADDLFIGFWIRRN